MASQKTLRPFPFYVTHVDSEGPFIKICGQLDKHSALMVESLLDSCIDKFEKGIGAVNPAALIEGIICVAKYKDGAYYRAKITNMSNIGRGLVGVHFIDFGNRDIISVSTIRLLEGFDTMLTQLRGQASDYLLARIMHPTGCWEEPAILKLQGLLSYSEHPCVVDFETRNHTVISVQLTGTDLSEHLILNGYGAALTLQKHEALLIQLEAESAPKVPNWQRNYSNDPNLYAEHIPFLTNQNFPSNPASAMRLQQNMGTVPFNGGFYQVPPSNISQRLLVHKAPRTAVNLRTPVLPARQARITESQSQPTVNVAIEPTALPMASTPPSLPTTPTKSGSPRKTTTYKSRLLEVNSQYKVFISFADEGPEIFAVQLVSDGKKLEEMMNEINRKPHRSLCEMPMIGTVCLGRMSGDRIICRAIVMNVSGSQCKLFFVDFGDTEMVSYYDIFDIPEEFVKPNVFAMRFCLSKVNKLRKGLDVNETFKRLVGGKVVTLKVVSPEGPPLIQYGELHLDNQNVLDLLIESTTKNLEFSYLEILELGSQYSVLVSYVDSCHKFFVQLTENIDELNAVMDAVRTHCECANAPLEIKVGTACCAKFPDDGNWYRANVLKVTGNRVTVAYVDYGNEQEVDISDIRTITSDLIQLPAQAMRCALKGFEDKPIETKTSNQLEMLALEKTLTTHIVGIVSDTMLVSLFDESVSPQLDVARRMMQLSQPRSVQESKVSAPVRRESTETSPDGSSTSQEGKKNRFRRELSFKEERRGQRDNDTSQHGGSFRSKGREHQEPFDRSAPSRYSDRTSSRQGKSDRQGGYKPWENKTENLPSSDTWEETSTQPVAEPSANRSNRDNVNTRDEWEDTQNDSRVNNAGDKKDYRSDRRENWSDRRDKTDRTDWPKREFKERGERGTRSNFTPRERAERSFGSDSDKNKSSGYSGGRERNGQAPPYKSRSKFTEVQYKDLPDPVPLETKYLEPSVEPEAQHEVSVTWIISPDSFYVQILSLQTKFLEMMEKIPELYKGVKPYTGDIPVGASVLSKYPEDGVLYRATVLSAQPFSKFIVQYIDFGNKFLVDARDLWQLDRQLIDLPKMAVHSSLIGVMPLDGEWKTNNDIDLCFNAPRYQCIFHELIGDKHKVSLWNNGVSVADMLVERQLAAASDRGTSVALKDEPIDLTIIIGQQMLCRVTHVDSFEKFYVQLDLDKASLVENAIANYNTKLLTPVTADCLADGIHCTVNHAGKVYRAILTDVSDSTNIQAVLPDYGNSIVTSIDNLMILPTELSVYYYQSLECCLNNFTETSNKLLTIEEFKERLTGNKFIIYINTVDGICLVTTIYDCVSGQKVAIFEPDEDAYEEVIPLCTCAVFNYNFGLAYISHCESLSEVYLQKSADGDKLAQQLDALFQFYEEGTPEPLETYELETLCAAKSSDSNWYRATITDVIDTEYKVQYLDYGNVETVQQNSIKKLDPKFYEPCALALVVSLGVTPLKDNAHNILIDWTTEKEIQVTLSFATNGWLANLHLDGVDLGIKLVNESLASAESYASEEQKTETKTDEPISLPAGCTQVYISHIDSPGQFWLQMSDKIDKIEEIQAELQENAESYSDVDTHEIDTLCVAKYSADELWYRAKILDSDADITTVRFIDYGNTDVLDNVEGVLKTLPANLKEIEALAVKSSVNAIPTGTGQWSESSSDYFTELVGDTSVPVDAQIVLKDISTYVDIYLKGQNITDKLVSEGHAVRSDEPECGDLASCYASHINSPSEFWIQLESAAPELQAMETAMVDAESFPVLADKEEGVLCAAQYPEDGLWYRAQVVVDGSEGTEVLFMDYGNASIATELRSLPEELNGKPALSRKCALQKPRNVRSWSRKCEIKFSELAAEGATVFKVQFIASGDISIVELYYEGKSVTEELVHLSEETPQAERPNPVGQDVLSSGKVSYSISADDFYVHLDESKNQLETISNKLLSSEEFEEVPELKIGSLCAAFWVEEEKWYRSKILEFCDIGAHVQFIDYGNKAKCEEFRQLPDDIVHIPPISKNCRIASYKIDTVTNENRNQRFADMVAKVSSFQIEFLDSTKEPILVKLLHNGKDVNVIISAELDNIAEDTQTESMADENIYFTSHINLEVKEKTLIESVSYENKHLSGNNENVHDLEQCTQETVDNHSEYLLEETKSQSDHNESLDSFHTVIGCKSVDTKEDDAESDKDISDKGSIDDKAVENFESAIEDTLETSNKIESISDIIEDTLKIEKPELVPDNDMKALDINSSQEKTDIDDKTPTKGSKDVKHKSPITDDSKESFNTDTGYTSEAEIQDKSINSLSPEEEKIDSLTMDINKIQQEKDDSRNLTDTTSAKGSENSSIVTDKESVAQAIKKELLDPIIQKSITLSAEEKGDSVITDDKSTVKEDLATIEAEMDKDNESALYIDAEEMTETEDSKKSPVIESKENFESAIDDTFETDNTDTDYNSEIEIQKELLNSIIDKSITLSMKEKGDFVITDNKSSVAEDLATKEAETDKDHDPALYIDAEEMTETKDSKNSPVKEYK